MKQKNRYYRRSRIAEAQFRKIVRCFALDLTAVAASELVGISVRSINTIFIRLRVRIAEECEKQRTILGIVEVDESYFGPKRVRGKRGRGAGQKTVVFGIYKRQGRVYTEIVPDCAKKTLQNVIRGKVDLASVIHSDGWDGYDGLVDVGYQKHFRVRHGHNEFAVGERHINGIESFWAFAKHRLAKLHGIRRKYFYYHLKECEYRFNFRHKNLYLEILRVLRENPL